MACLDYHIKIIHVAIHMETGCHIRHNCRSKPIANQRKIYYNGLGLDQRPYHWIRLHATSPRRYRPMPRRLWCHGASVLVGLITDLRLHSQQPRCRSFSYNLSRNYCYCLSNDMHQSLECKSVCLYVCLCVWLSSGAAPRFWKWGEQILQAKRAESFFWSSTFWPVGENIA